MKKFFSLVLALVMALSLTTVAWGATTVTNETDLKNAVLAGGEVVLGGDVEITESIRLSSTATVDLAGHKLTGPDDGSANWYAFIVETGGKLTLKDSSTAQTGVLFAKCYGVETKGGTFVMESGKIDATTNGGIGAAIVNYGGTVIVNDGEIVASHAAVNTQSYFAAATTEINGGKLETESTTSAAVQVGEEYSRSTETVTINGGEIIGTVAVSVDEDTADVTIAGGDVEGTVAASAGDLTVTGGTYTVPASAEPFLGNGYVLENGVVKIDISGAKTSYEGLYLKGTGQGDVITPYAVNLGYYKEVAIKYDDEGKLVKNGDMAFFVTDDTNFSGAYVQVNTLAEADVVAYLDAAGKIVKFYLAEITNSNYYDGVVFYNFGKDCNQVNLGDAFDKTATYYTIKGEDTNLYVSAKNGSMNLKVGTQYVAVNYVGAIEDYDVDHKIVTESVNGKITKIYCSGCGTQAVEAPNFMSLPKGADQDGLTGNWYWATTIAGTTDKTVTSAETFDAGIAMYVGMSVMAAAGSAVVIGKKRED